MLPGTMINIKEIEDGVSWIYGTNPGLHPKSMESLRVSVSCFGMTALDGPCTRHGPQHWALYGFQWALLPTALPLACSPWLSDVGALCTVRMPSIWDHALIEPSIYFENDVESWLDMVRTLTSTALCENFLNNYSSVLQTTNKNDHMLVLSSNGKGFFEGR